MAHCFINRLGESISQNPWITPWRATKLEVRVLGEKSRGLFVHTEMVEPRRRDPSGSPGNDAIAPKPGFTEPQLDRLALLYVTASVQHGTWMIPAYHAAVDAGIPDGHDDPQNFDLALWATHLGALIQTLNAGTNTARLMQRLSNVLRRNSRGQVPEGQNDNSPALQRWVRQRDGSKSRRDG